MRQLRKNVAIAIDGGGIRGTIVARALSVLETRKAFGDKTCDEVFHLAAGTSTGSIISPRFTPSRTACVIDCTPRKRR